MLIDMINARLCTLFSDVRRVQTCAAAARVQSWPRSIVQRIQSCSAFNRAARSIVQRVQSRATFNRAARSNVYDMASDLYKK